MGFWPAMIMAWGGVVGCLAVAMAAVAAHALPAALTAKDVAGVQAAIQMQGWHALALLAVASHAARAAGLARRLALAAGAAIAVGVTLFCAAVYAHHLAGLPSAGIAPAGGMLLMAGWLLLTASALAAARA